MKTFVQSQLKANNSHFVAIVDNQVTAWCDIRREAPAGISHCGTLGMGVLSAYRGQGVGEQLLCTKLNKAKTFGIERVELAVRADNQRAYNLYRKLGFVEEGVKRRSVKIDGVYHDRILMALEFSPQE